MNRSLWSFEDFRVSLCKILNLAASFSALITRAISCLLKGTMVMVHGSPRSEFKSATFWLPVQSYTVTRSPSSAWCQSLLFFPLHFFLSTFSQSKIEAKFEKENNFSARKLRKMSQNKILSLSPIQSLTHKVLSH